MYAAPVALRVTSKSTPAVFDGKFGAVDHFVPSFQFPDTGPTQYAGVSCARPTCPTMPPTTTAAARRTLPPAQRRRDNDPFMR